MAQIHFPLPIWPQATLADGLQEAMDLGLTSSVGVCNYSMSQMEDIHGLLAAKSIPLASNQVHLHHFLNLNQPQPACHMLATRFAGQTAGQSVLCFEPLNGRGELKR